MEMSVILELVDNIVFVFVFLKSLSIAEWFFLFWYEACILDTI